METPLYFISDIHLMLDHSTDEQHRREGLFRLMDKVKGTGGTLFFVGDLFDFYFEYPDLIPKAFADFYTKVLELKKSGIAFHFLLGNHDYWVQDYMMKDIMDEVYFGDMEFSINDRHFYITHGDASELGSWLPVIKESSSQPSLYLDAALVTSHDYLQACQMDFQQGTPS